MIRKAFVGSFMRPAARNGEKELDDRENDHMTMEK
jgi:hypothetical protein